MPQGYRSASILLVMFLSGCALTSRASEFNGLKDVEGSEAVHINMTKVALHFAVVMPFIGDASLKGAVRDFTEEAKKKGAERVRIVQSNETTLWWILPPVSFLLTPRFTNVAGEALLAFSDTTAERGAQSMGTNP
jgi:CRISPR/Cas system CMR subunit Cmr6 (Cas7 group RAMP superfamily)